MDERLERRQAVRTVPDWTDLLNQPSHDRISPEVFDGSFVHNNRFLLFEEVGINLFEGECERGCDAEVVVEHVFRGLPKAVRG